MFDVVCVWFGNKYPEEYITNLFKGVKAHTTEEFRFNIITDKKTDIESKIPCRVVKPDTDYSSMLRGDNLWWWKLQMFSPHCEFSKHVLYLDLDLVILNDIDKFFMYSPDKFVICQDFNRQYMPTYHVSNSSVMRFSPRKTIKMFNEFNKNPKLYINRFRGDQDYITHWFENPKRADQKRWWPHDWAMSYKWELEMGGKRNNGTDRNSYHEPDKPVVIPEECSIAVCHGDPKPTEVHKKIRKLWINK